MRALIVASLGLLTIATSASVQVQQSNPNAANQSMEASSRMRSMQQQGTT